MLTVEEFKDLSEAYFDGCISESRPMTITGLALALGFASKQSIYDYSKDRDYKHVVGRAKMMVEHGYELRLHEGQCTGAIFALKSFDSGHWGVEHDGASKDHKPITINFVDAQKQNAD